MTREQDSCPIGLPVPCSGAACFITCAVYLTICQMRFGAPLRVTAGSPFSIGDIDCCIAKKGSGTAISNFLPRLALGAWHRWESLPLLVFLAALIASINVMAMYVINGKGALKNPLPFGPFLAAAGFIIGWKTLLSGS